MSGTPPSKAHSLNKEALESSTTTTATTTTMTCSTVEQPKRNPAEEEIISALRSISFFLFVVFYNSLCLEIL
jgi:hypothetical protein